jgi:hypothetical protein
MSSPFLHALSAIAAGTFTDLVSRVAAIVEPWSKLYGDSTAVSITVLFVHIASLVVAGGLAIAADRGTLRATSRAAAGARRRQLLEIGATHRPVLVALTLTLLSGVLLFLSDAETYAEAPAFWAKMVLVALLLGNGLVMSRAESALRTPSLGTASVDAAPQHWARLRRTAIVSATLWLATVLAGTVLGSV